VHDRGAIDGGAQILVEPKLAERRHRQLHERAGEPGRAIAGLALLPARDLAPALAAVVTIPRPGT